MSPKKGKTKTAMMTMRVDPQVKTAAELAAAHERRSVTSLIEVLVLNHCREIGIDVPIPRKKEETKK